MANTITLDSIRDAAEAKYGSTDIQLSDGSTVSLLNPLRLPKARRDELSGLQKDLEADDVDQEDVLCNGIRCIAKSAQQAKALLKEVGGDLAVLATIFESYVEGTQAGEASASDA